jgi:hypothetical protein
MATIRAAFIYGIFKAKGPEEPEEEKKQDARIVDIPLNVGADVLDVWNDGCYILVCTNSGVECLNSRTFESIWYFNSTIVRAVCSNQEAVCLGTICSGVYYSDFPKAIEDLGDFLSSCNVVSSTVSNSIADICTTVSGFFVGGDSGVDILVGSGTDLKINHQATYSVTNSVAYSVSTEIYYWATASTIYSGYYNLDIKSTATPGCVINSINVENLDGEDVLYINTASGVVRAFSVSCSGIIDDRNIVSSDYVSGDCGTEKIVVGYNTSLLEIDTTSGTEESFELVGDVSEVLYYVW